MIEKTYLRLETGDRVLGLSRRDRKNKFATVLTCVFEGCTHTEDMFEAAKALIALAAAGVVEC